MCSSARAINSFTAVIWYLRNYENGKYGTIAHSIKLLQPDYDKLFSILRMEPTIETLIKPFINAYYHAPKMLEAMMASPTGSLGKSSSENIYYVLSGNDIRLMWPTLNIREFCVRRAIGRKQISTARGDVAVPDGD